MKARDKFLILGIVASFAVLIIDALLSNKI